MDSSVFLLKKELKSAERQLECIKKATKKDFVQEVRSNPQVRFFATKQENTFSQLPELALLKQAERELTILKKRKLPQVNFKKESFIVRHAVRSENRYVSGEKLLNQLKEVEKEVKVVHNQARPSVKFEKVTPQMRSFAQSVGRGVSSLEEFNELKELEREINNLEKKKLPKVSFPIQQVFFRSIDQRRFITESESVFKIEDKKVIKVLEKEINHLKKKKISFNSKPKTTRPLLPEYFFTVPLFQQLLLLEDKIKMQEYPGSLDLYFEVLRAFKEDHSLPPSLRQVFFMRFLEAYRAIRGTFFKMH